MKLSAIVMLHGWGYRPVVFEELAGALTDKPHPVPVLLPILHLHHDQNLEEWADSLAQGIPTGSTLIGWSLGAMLAICLAARHPQKIHSLVLIGATPRFVNGEGWECGLDREVVSSFCATFSKQPQRTMERFIALQVLNDSQRHTVKNNLTTALANIEIEQVSLRIGLHLLANSDLRHIVVQQPCLLIHGKNDALMPLSAAQWLHQHYPNSRLETYLNIGHAPFVSNPYKVGQDIQRFLRAL